MQHEFWHEKWESNNIGFHLPQPHPFLIQHFERLQLPQPSRIFLPLCGKTLDIHWLLSQGHQIVAIDLSPIAIKALIEDLGVDFIRSESSTTLTHYHHPHIDLFVGDIFNLRQEQIGDIDAIYDRAALVALPFSLRTQYAKHVIQISRAAPQLLIHLEYDQQHLAGPPFSISYHELLEYYSPSYELKLINSQVEKLKGKVDAQEKIWLLDPLII